MVDFDDDIILAQFGDGEGGDGFGNGYSVDCDYFGDGYSFNDETAPPNNRTVIVDRVNF